MTTNNLEYFFFQLRKLLVSLTGSKIEKRLIWQNMFCTNFTTFLSPLFIILHHPSCLLLSISSDFFFLIFCKICITWQKQLGANLTAVLSQPSIILDHQTSVISRKCKDFNLTRRHISDQLPLRDTLRKEIFAVCSYISILSPISKF